MEDYILGFMLNNSIAILGKIEKDPSGITGFISSILGAILNVLFNISEILVRPGSLAFSIIGVTIIVRLLMFPLGIKQQHSTAIMQHLQPEVAKIKKKYGDTKDPELTRKMNVEIQNLYSKSGSNPILGCLPLLITLPIFIALFALLKHSYLYIDSLNALYSEIAGTIQQGLAGISGDALDAYHSLVGGKLPKNMNFDSNAIADVMRLVNKCSSSDWVTLKGIMPDVGAQLDALVQQKVQIESLFGINLVDIAGWSFPNVIMPILTAVATFLSSLVSVKTMRSSEPTAMQTQKIMMVVMPLMMIFMAASMSSGVGLYWTVSSSFQAVQQFALSKYYDEERIEAFMKKRAEKLNKRGAK